MRSTTRSPGLPEDRVRHHFCWGSWHGAHTHDIAMKDVIDLVLQVRAQAYSFEAGNVRHEHEWTVWKDIKLPDGKVIVPGRDQPCDQYRRASRADRAAHSKLCVGASGARM